MHGEKPAKQTIYTLKNCVTIWIKCLHLHGIGSIQSILCLILGVTTMPESAVKLKQTQETSMVKSPSVPPTAVKYSSKISAT